ncbi:NifB/NifX family molybdenum-iron cluster-binding protein [Maridesulfovibrio sp.]|uniref:NifB/NifX family molybdenum-iron cluster-binding protein n=1 Tax=Maridesulfovibrio sp. TaxID=2795000 RepID=UPI002AA7B738|nr:NifB/NifX family molybdenum-iron cluster-binding protein [Maridesulfovibrio sp.]
MKIAVPCTDSDLDGSVAPKLGTAKYVLLIDSNDMSFEVLDGPPKDVGSGAGVSIISLAANNDAQALLVGYAAPHIVNAMKGKSLKIVTGVKGKVRDAVQAYLIKNSVGSDGRVEQSSIPGWRELWISAFRKGLRQFYQLLPKLAGVIMLLGLFRGFISEKDLFALFSGSAVQDSILGATVGSVLVGNPVNSYVIGDSLLNAGVNLSGIIALMMAWVTVGVIQLPAESAALGIRFAVVRNLCGFVMAVVMSLLVTSWGGLF